MRVFVRTFGCTFNQADSQTIKGVLERAGHAIVGTEADADIIVVNTCGVKGPTERRVLSYVASLNGRNVVVAGCLPLICGEKVRSALPGFSAMVGPDAETEIEKVLERVGRGENGLLFLSGEPLSKTSLPRMREGVIAPVQIAHGCLGKCSYCCVRRARGALRSVPLEAIVAEVKKATEEGAREIQLTAQDTGAYGKDHDTRTGIAELLCRVGELDGDFRVRLGMINPQHAAPALPKLIEAFRSEKVYKFLHLPVQSGSDDVLERMNREYASDDFRKIVSAFRRSFPEMTIATDLIVGFPEESDEDFEMSMRLLTETRPDVVNVSKFAPRPDTPALRMRQLPNKTIKERSAAASELCRRLTKEANVRLIGKTRRVLMTERGSPYMKGRDECYRQVLVPGVGFGEFVKARIIAATPSSLVGEPID